MKLFLSFILDENTPSYGNRDKFTIKVKSQINEGNGANTSSWFFSNNHIGTHFDSPNHFFEKGKKTKDYKAEDFCFYNISIIEKKCEEGNLIDLDNDDLNDIDIETDFLIIKTGYGNFRSTDKYHNDNPGLVSTLASVLKKRFKKIRAVGFDFISLTSWNHREHGKLSHKEFLGESNNILIVEDMDLSQIDKDSKLNNLIMAPLRTIDGNGAPVTIICDKL